MAGAAACNAALLARIAAMYWEMEPKLAVRAAGGDGAAASYLEEVQSAMPLVRAELQGCVLQAATSLKEVTGAWLQFTKSPGAGW